MSKCKIKLNSKNVRALLKSEWIMAICQDKATEIRKRAGDGYATSKYVGKNRVNVSVYAKTKEAKQDSEENKTLLKALR